MMPVVPPEGTYTETEFHFIEAQPPGLWPENQDSIFGQFRKVICDILQGRRDEIEMLSQERFVPASTRYLSLWEEMLGVSIAPTGKTIAQRRAALETRLKWGAFSRSQRDAIIESFILPTMTGGPPAAFTPSGIPFGAGGIPLYGAGGDVKQKYRVYEDPVNFAYTVWIDSANVPDIGALTRELSRVTPSGISFTIDTTHTGTGLINWSNTVKNFAPSGWWKLDADYLDYSGLGHTGIVTGAPAAIAAPGLMLSAGTDGARDFSGTGQYVTISDSPRLNSNIFTWRADVRPDALPSAGTYMMVFTQGPGNYFGIVNTSGSIKFVFSLILDGVQYVISSTTTPVVGTTYRLAAKFDGLKMKLFVNGVKESEASHTGILSGGTKYIGSYIAPGDYLWNGALDEVAYFGYPLSDTDILYLSNQARNIL